MLFAAIASPTLAGEPKRAEVTYDPDKVSPQALAKALGDAGYPATLAKP